MGLFIRIRGSAWALVALTVVLSTSCQNGRKSSNRKAAVEVAPTVTTPQPPSAYLAASPTSPYGAASYVEASVGDTVQFRWNGENVDLLHSYFTIDAADTCAGAVSGTGPIGWVANTVTGTTTLTTLPCQAGRTYTYSYEATDSPSGKMSHAIAMVHVMGGGTTPPQGTIRVTQMNGNDLTPPRGLIELNPGEFIKVAWDGNGANSILAETIPDSADTCAAATLSFPEVQQALTGVITKTLGTCAAGHTYTVNLKSTRGATTAIESRMIVRVRTNPTLALPTATLTANGTAGSAEVTAGQQLTFEWASTGADQGDSLATMTTDIGALICEDDVARGATPTSWDALGPSGTIPAFTIPDCKARHTFSISFTAYQTQTGKSATSTLTLKVNPRPGT